MSGPIADQPLEEIVRLLPCEPGTYLLIMAGPRPGDGSKEIPIGKLGCLKLQPGFYFYAGSAHGPGGLRARLGRHLRPNPTRRWHIDYLKSEAPIVAIWYLTGPRSDEHISAAVLYRDLKAAIPLPRFGASDCSCPAHLFFLEKRPELSRFVKHFEKRSGGAVITEINVQKDEERSGR